MTEIVRWLNSNQGFAMTVLTLVYVVATLTLVGVMIQANRISARNIATMLHLEAERSRPSVICHLRIERSAVSVVVKNIGMTTASNVRFSANPPVVICFESMKGRPIPFLEKIIPHLHPNQEMCAMLGMFWDVESVNPSLLYHFELEYDGPSGSYRDESTLDMTLFADSPYMRRADLTDVNTVLEKIGKDLHHIATGFSKPVVKVEMRDQPTQSK